MVQVNFKEDICFLCRIYSMVIEEFFITTKLQKMSLYLLDGVATMGDIGQFVILGVIYDYKRIDK